MKATNASIVPRQGIAASHERTGFLYLCEFRSVLFVVALAALGDDLRRLFWAEEFTNNACARLLQRLVVFPVVLGLLLEVFSEIVNGLDVVATLVTR